MSTGKLAVKGLMLVVLQITVLQYQICRCTDSAFITKFDREWGALQVFFAQ